MFFQKPLLKPPFTGIYQPEVVITQKAPVTCLMPLVYSRYAYQQQANEPFKPREPDVTNTTPSLTTLIKVQQILKIFYFSF